MSFILDYMKEQASKKIELEEMARKAKIDAARARAIPELLDPQGSLSKIPEIKPPVYRQLTGKVAMLMPIPHQCPECLDDLQTSIDRDKIRIHIIHHDNGRCSRSNTEVVRTIAEFTVFI